MFPKLLWKMITAITLLMIMTLVQAEEPMWTIVPTTPTTVSVPANGTASVKYRVTNQSRKAHSLIMKAIPGITQVETPGDCSLIFLLQYHQSCILNLTINGDTLPENVTGGPVICDEGNLLQCYQPITEEDSLHITKEKAEFTVGGLVSGLQGILVLQNNGSETLSLNNNGTFTFPTPIPQGESYSVTIFNQPSNQTCIITNGSGTINNNVTNVEVTCTTNTVTKTIGGTLSGLSGGETVVLQNNNGDNLSLSTNGSFTFSTPVAQGTTYSVTVLTQPTTQTCMVTNGSGTVGSSNVTNVAVTCTTNTRTVGGSLSGLSGGETVVLQNNNGDNLSLSANGSFTFSTPVAQGTPYSVTILTQPPSQTCTVMNGSGIIGASNVTNVTVLCSANGYSVGGTLSGLAGGETVVLQNNNGDNLSLNANGGFTFSTLVAQGAAYSVTVLTQPTTQTCIVTNGSGIVGSSNVTNIAVSCTTNMRTVGGSLSGLAVGQTVVLQNNGGDNLSLNANGGFTFATSVAQGSPYSVTVLTQPATQTCIVTNGSGTVGSSNITDVNVTCTINSYTVGGTLTGLDAMETVVLTNNGEDLTLTTTGSFSFPTPVNQGATYNVTIQTQPATQTCSVTNGSGTMGSSNVTNVSISCSDNTYSVGGTVFGLQMGQTVVLQNNGGDDLTITADGSFTFSTPLITNASYSVTVLTQPAIETCTISNGSGTIANANITNVVVNCSVNTHTVGGTLSGLNSSQSVVLQNNNTDDLTLSSNGAFVFSTPVAQSASYSVTVLTQPYTQTCTVMNGSGTISTSNVTNVGVNCNTTSYTVGGTLSGLPSGQSVVLQNNNSNNLSLSADGAFTFTTPVAQGATYAVTVLTQPSTHTCVVSNGTGTISGSNVTNVGVTCTLNTTTLTTSVSSLALSRTGYTEYGVTGTPSSGVPRIITITNIGGYTATGLTISYPTFPTGTTSSSTCGSTLASSATCTITITPGAVASSDGTNPCSTGTAPIPGNIAITSNNAATVNATVVILSYGCIYRGGYIYAFDDTVANTASVKGKVAIDAGVRAAGIIWASNGAGPNAASVSLVNIPGIYDTSTTPCVGLTDGVCNTTQIYNYYGPSGLNVNNAYYATGVCRTTLATFSDWYLPAICELGSFRSGVNPGCGTLAAPLLQNIEVNLIRNGVGFVGGLAFPSSTESSADPTNNYWYQFLSPTVDRTNTEAKSFQRRVVCSRIF